MENNYYIVMKAANAIINALMCCDDGDFVDEVIARIASADPFEIEEDY